jgi:NADP-dependent aldehyde dehydrogenase
MEGHLTATLHGTDEDIANHAELIDILKTKVGRLLINGFPTGIEVCHSMHHGGPWPAASHPFFGSIGTRSILRFVRPMVFQGFPQAALPDELKNENVRGIWRTIDGEHTKDDC